MHRPRDISRARYPPSKNKCSGTQWHCAVQTVIPECTKFSSYIARENLPRYQKYAEIPKICQDTKNLLKYQISVRYQKFANIRQRTDKGCVIFERYWVHFILSCDYPWVQLKESFQCSIWQKPNSSNPWLFTRSPCHPLGSWKPNKKCYWPAASD